MIYDLDPRTSLKSGTCQERIVSKEKLGSFFIKVSVVVVPTYQDIQEGLSPKVLLSNMKNS